MRRVRTVTPDERAALYADMDANPSDYTPYEWALLDALDAETGARALDNAQHREAYSLMHRSFTAAAAERDEARAALDQSEREQAGMAAALSMTTAALDRVRAECDAMEAEYPWFWTDAASRIRRAIEGGA